MATDSLAAFAEIRTATVELVNAAISTRRFLGELADLLRMAGTDQELASLAAALDDLDGAIAVAQGLL